MRDDKTHARLESFVRKTLRIPFRLHVRYKRIIAPNATTYVLIHGLADSGGLWKPLLEYLPADANYIVVDLLGHGKSPMSSAAVYSADYQARNVLATCLAQGCIGHYVFIGHSFGSIVAVECARRYMRTQRLILCSLPLYNQPHRKLDPLEPESILFDIYARALQRPADVIAAYNTMDRYRLGGSSKIVLTKKTFPAFLQTLKAGIINQQTTNHLMRLSVPVTLIYGRLDPVVIGKNLQRVARKRQNITVVPLINDHALRPVMVRAIVKAIRHETHHG